MRRVKIQVSGVQHLAEQNEENFELLTDGKYTRTADGDSVFTYRESEITGMGDTVTTFRIGKNGVITLAREGEYNSVMRFEPGKSDTTIMYNTPFGSFALDINTRLAKADFDNNGGVLELEYSLDSGHMFVGKSKLNIVVSKE
ncbi:MAG: DUF1934 domain-containing protein [Oscillospiraceae bacterium]|jgi:uncharacterized beta-barrel protein YwiB (DUF1934 family)|nr:DUF1934 domain-containing protein [Oscillospiraceae bacterium]